MAIAKVTCTFDGVVLNVGNCVITDISRPLLTDIILNTQEIPGRDGVRYLGERRGPFDVTVTFAMWTTSEGDLREAVHLMSSMLAVDSPRRLVFSDEPTCYYEAIPQGVTDFEQLDRFTGRFTVTFHVPDGYVHEAAKTASGTASSRQASFTMDGSAECLIKITVPSATGNFTFADSTGSYCTVSCPSTAATLVIDGPNGTVKHGNTVLMMTLTSDFLKAYPGSNVIYEQVGSKAFTVEYYPRW